MSTRKPSVWAAGLPRLVHKRMGMEWPAAAGVVDDCGYCGRGPAQVSASGVDTVAFRSFGVFCSFGEGCFIKAYFFSAQFFFVCPPLSTLFLFTEFVYGIHLIFFQSSCIESLSLRSFRPSRPWERPMCARSTLEFQPASSTQSRASVPRAYRAKRVAENES